MMGMKSAVLFDLGLEPVNAMIGALYYSSKELFGAFCNE